MELRDHIGIFKNGVPDALCDEMIEFFEKTKALNLTYTRQEATPGMPTTRKQDEAVDLRANAYACIGYDNTRMFTEMMDSLWTCYHKYTAEYSELREAGRHVIADGKIQKTLPAQGYHVWHFEKDGYDYARRVAVFIVYLNDVVDGGETEFLRQSLRVKPEKGTVVVWPSSYTHTHRGNPPLKDDKYIFTGWFEFMK